MKQVSPDLPSLAIVTQRTSPWGGVDKKTHHVLVVLPSGDDWCGVPGHAQAETILARRGKKAADLEKNAQAVELPGGCLSVWLRLDDKKGSFAWQGQLRLALKPLLDEHPKRLDIAVYGPDEFRTRVAKEAAYVTWVNCASLPNWKSEKAPTRLETIQVHGMSGLDLAREAAQAEGNTLCRRLTMLPPNLLTPASYRQQVRDLAKAMGWSCREYDVKALKKLKAGAFLAVSRGSGHEDAAIVRLGYKVQSSARRKVKTVALVGKGICFDTGGHNLKPARYMNNMHDDMNGSAVALGILLAATRLKLPVNLEVWLAIAQNHLSPEAYTQNEVVTAMNGTTIEIVHTDAEGRMVLADALAMASKEKPDVMVDFATLTGSMAVAVGERMSGVIGNRADLISRAVETGQAVGERVVAFPMPEDYDEALDSPVADVKQCTLDSEADHILAARFLNRFVGDIPWLHMDLSASRCKGGLGAVGSDITGFGVAWGVAMLSGELP